MNLLLHQFRKDLRHARVLVGLWLVLILARFALVNWNASPGDYAMQQLYTTISGLTEFLSFVLILVLIPLVIHQEPLVGTTAFWFSRPLSRFTLLRAKGLFVLVLLALPLIVQTVVFVANGVTWHDVALAVPELALFQGAWMLAVATLAVLTPGTGRFVITAASFLVGFLIYVEIANMVQNFYFRNNSSDNSTSLSNSRTVVSCLLLIVSGTWAIVHQYLTRRTVFSIAVAVVGLVGYSAAAQFWPWNFLKPSYVFVPDPQFHDNGIGTPVLRSINVSDLSNYRVGEPGKRVQGRLLIPGCPSGYLIRIESIDSTLKTSEGQKINVDNLSLLTFNPPESEPLTQALGGIPVMNMTQFYGPTPTALFDLSASNYNQVASATLDYSAKVSCDACKYTVTAELPVTKGSRFVRGSERETITDVLRQDIHGNNLSLSLQKQSVTLMFAPRVEQERGYWGQPRDRVIYVLLNRKRREAVVQRLDSSDSYYRNEDEILSHRPMQLFFGPENPGGVDKALYPLFDQAWLNDAVLVRLELTRVAEFTRSFTVPNFRLDGSYRDPGASPQADTIADLPTLDKITLPSNANREQTRAYITAILQASAMADRFSDSDPQVKMLEQVGAQNVDLLIEMARANHNYYLNRAIFELAQDDHKNAIVLALATNYDLIDTIVAHHWEKKAEAVLLAGLGDNNYRPDGWIAAVVSLKDPASYEALRKYYVLYPRRKVFDLLTTLPTFDLKGAVDEAWRKERPGNDWTTRELLAPAFQFGEAGTLDRTLKILQRNDPYSRAVALQTLKDYTPAVGAKDDDLIAWLEKNKDNLVYDPATQKFVLKSAPAPPAPAGSPAK